MNRLSVTNEIITRQYYDHSGSLKYNQVLLPKHLVSELFQSLHREVSKHPGIAKMLHEIRIKYLLPRLSKNLAKKGKVI